MPISSGSTNVPDSHVRPVPLDRHVASDPFADVDFSQLERSLRRPRTLVDFTLTALVTGMLLWRGGQRLSVQVLTRLPPAPLEQGGGFGNAIIGTLLIVALAVAATVPIGLLTAIYLAADADARKEKGGRPLASTVRFCAKVLTGFPSILAGVFAYGAIVLVTGGYSAFAGALALSILMLPTIVLTSEDAIRMVPARMKDAAIG